MTLTFFDSGAGGLSLLCAAYRLLPDVDYIYYADTLNAPLGNKSEKEIISVLNKAVDFLLCFKPDAVILACNTATGYGIKSLRANGRVDGGGVKFFGVEPAVKPACENTADGNILVLATVATFRQGNLKGLLKKYDGGNILSCPCKNLARVVEENILERSDDIGGAGVYGAGGGKIKAELRRIFSGYLDKNIKAVVLGCTHYVLIKNLIQGYFPSAVIFDGNEGTAKNIVKSLSANAQNNAAAPSSAPVSNNAVRSVRAAPAASPSIAHAGGIKIFTSANDEKTTLKYKQILQNLLNN
jgi:glutamate racemase